MTEDKRQDGERDLMNQMDAIVHALGIEDSHVTPVEKIEGLFQQIEALQQRVVDLDGVLSDLINAARGMPISHDNLCQSALDHAIEAAEEALYQEPGEGGGGEAVPKQAQDGDK